MQDRPNCGLPPELVCPAVAADIAAFRLHSEESGSYRRDAGKKLQLLLIRRGIEPFRGMWALPGGFLRPDETVEECAQREIGEETGVAPRAMIPIGVFSGLDRDPRGRIISHAFAAVMSGPSASPRGGTDAESARWFDVSFTREGEDAFTLCLRDGETSLQARLLLREQRFGRRSFDVTENSGLAFDHAAIVASALSALRETARYPEALLDLVPEPFTLAELQQVQETITEAPTGAANFRRKIADYVEETDGTTAGAGHRPARLYRRRRERTGSP